MGTSDDGGAFFDYFGETNMLALFVELGASLPSIVFRVQLLQTMSISVQNIATRTLMYYTLSNNHVNRLLECPFLVDCDDGVRDWYVTLLKALSLRLNDETVQLSSTRSKTRGRHGLSTLCTRAGVWTLQRVNGESCCQDADADAECAGCARASVCVGA